MLHRQSNVGSCFGRPSFTWQDSFETSFGAPFCPALPKFALTPVCHIPKAVARTGTKSVAVLSKSPEWPEIVALLRLDLALSFDSKVQAQMFFPDILHICVAIVAVGPLFVRHAVCSLLVNTIHSLAKAEGLQGDRVRLGHLVDALSGPRSEYLFGLSEDVNDESMAWTVTTAGEELVRLLADILEAVAPTVGKMAFPSSVFWLADSLLLKTRQTHGALDGRDLPPPAVSSIIQRCSQEHS